MVYLFLSSICEDKKGEILCCVVFNFCKLCLFKSNSSAALLLIFWFWMLFLVKQKHKFCVLLTCCHKMLYTT